MLELKLPVIFRPGKDGEDDYIVERTFTDSESDVADLIAPFQKAAQAYFESHTKEVTT